MNKQSMLTSAALLSKLAEHKNRDYLDIIGEFVLRCLPDKAGTLIDVDEVVNLLRMQYGFSDIPRHVVLNVLGRLRKQRTSGTKYVRRHAGEYYTLTDADHTNFDESYQKMNRHISEVLNALTKYRRGRAWTNGANENRSAEILFDFFEVHGLTVARDRTQLLQITKKSGKDNYQVARFILGEFEKDSPVSYSLTEIVKGFLVSKAVYFYSKDVKKTKESKLNKSMFFLDCSLLIDALGYETKSELIALEEMLNLIRTNGGRVCVFEHTVDEASNLLYSFAKNPDNRNNFRLRGLEEKNFPAEILESLSAHDSINRMLGEKGIEVIAKPAYITPKNNPRDKYVSVEDEIGIKEQLISYRSHSAEREDSRRIDFDVASLSAIGRLRKNYQPTTIENSRAILVTQGSTIIKCMPDLEPDRFSQEINFAFSDVDLVSLLWLGQNNSQSQVPQQKLISLAVAAADLTSTIMDEAIELATRMEKEERFDPENVLIIRRKAAMRSILADITENDPSSLSEKMIEKAIDIYVKRKSEPIAEEAHALGYAEGLRDSEEEHKKKEREKINSLAREAEEIAKQAAKRSVNCVQLLIYIVSFFLFSAALFSWIQKNNYSSNWIPLVASIISLLELIIFFGGALTGDFKNKILTKVSEARFARVQAKELKKRNIFSDS